jgi:hypothetical protein
MSDDIKYQPIIMARPVNLTDMDRRVSREIGFDLSNPYPGSIQSPAWTVASPCGWALVSSKP